MERTEVIKDIHPRTLLMIFNISPQQSRAVTGITNSRFKGPFSNASPPMVSDCCMWYHTARKLSAIKFKSVSRRGGT